MWCGRIFDSTTLGNSSSRELGCLGVVVTQLLDGDQFRTFDNTVDTHIRSIIGLLNPETIVTATPDFR